MTIGIVEQRAGEISPSPTTMAGETNRSPIPCPSQCPWLEGRTPDAKVRPFLEGLLPDNRRVLEGWARRFQVSPGNPFALLTHMGEDCAGAIQLVAPSRVAAMLASPDDVNWLSEEQIADLLRDLVERHGTGRIIRRGRPIQPRRCPTKTALFHDGRRWGIPSGRTPTTHILKPPAQPDLDGFEINEHFCLNLG